MKRNGLQAIEDALIRALESVQFIAQTVAESRELSLADRAKTLRAIAQKITETLEVIHQLERGRKRGVA